jgi:hypothetical protein
MDMGRWRVLQRSGACLVLVPWMHRVQVPGTRDAACCGRLMFQPPAARSRF